MRPSAAKFPLQPTYQIKFTYLFNYLLTTYRVRNDVQWSSFMFKNLSYLYLGNRVLFRVYISSSKGRGGLEEFEAVMQTHDYVSSLHNFRKFSKPSECLEKAIYVNMEKVLYCFYS